MSEKSKKFFQDLLRSVLPKKRGKELLKDLLRKLALILVGSVIYSVAISIFLDPNSLAPGGVSGIAIIISHYVPIPTGTLILAINIPLMIWGAIRLGLGTMLSTIFTTFFSSWLVNIFAKFPPLTTEPILAALFGGACLALGMGLIFKAESTTGGTDIIVRIIRLKLPQFTAGRLFLMTDACVVAASAIVFKNVNTALFAALACFVNSVLFDYVLYGGDNSKLLYIISENHEAITRRLLEEIEVGVTYLEGEGAYTHGQKKVVMCAIKNQFYPRTRQLVLEEDPNAFMIVGQSSEIFGEGFKPHDEPLL